MRSPRPSLPKSADSPLTRGLRWGGVLSLGVVAGFCNGLLGAAGGVLIVLLLPMIPLPPALALAYGEARLLKPFKTHLSRRDLLATSMAVMLPISAVSGVTYWLGGVRPSGDMTVALVVPAILGGLLGARLLGRLPEAFLRRLFALLLVISGVRMLF